MADAKGEEILGEHQIPPQLSKRKPDVESVADETAAIHAKKLKPDGYPDPLPREEAGDGGHSDPPKEEEVEGEENSKGGDSVSSNGKAAVDKGKRVVTAVDKGKGKMVVEDNEEEDEEDDDDSDDSDKDDDSDDDGGDVVAGEGGYESDFSDDPLAEVDLSNILPSRTRRRGPPPPGAYLVNDLDDDEEEEDDDDICD